MSTEQTDNWSELEKEAQRPRIEPWLFFGLTLVLTIGALLFAAVTWLVQGQRTDTVLAAQRLLNEQLETTRLEMGEQIAEKRKRLEELSARAEAVEKERDSLRESEAALEEEKRSLGGEREALKREVAALTDDLKRCREMDLYPQRLPLANAKDVFGERPVFTASVELQVVDAGPRLSRGAIAAHVDQRLREEGIGRGDGTGDQLFVSVLASGNRQTVLSVEAMVVRRWKVPGQEKAWYVRVWSDSRIGVTSPDNAQHFIERLVDDLIDDLVDVTRP